MVNWFQIVETLYGIDMIEENSIIFTTGVNIENAADLEELVLLQSKSKASGTVLVLGGFLKSVPQSVIDYCNENQYPLFIIHHERALSKVMRILSYEILRSEKASIELSAALKDAISFPSKVDLYLPVFQEYGFMEYNTYCMAVVEPSDRREHLERGTAVKMIKVIEKILMSYGDKSFIISSESVFLILFSNYIPERIIFIIEKILSALKKMYPLGFYLSIGPNLSGITHISESYQYAEKINSFLKNQNIKNQVYEFDKLGLYKVIMSVQNTKVLKNYMTEMLGKLIEYDKENKTNLYEVLKLYLDNDGSVKAVSELLFLHRNSINYKIKKIEELLQCDLSTTKVRTKLYLAFLIEYIV